jgi:hypothetical protein
VAYGQYEFAHKSLHEYFVASYMVKLDVLPEAELLTRNPDVAAVAIALSSRPSLYMAAVVRQFMLSHPANLVRFVVPFIHRLGLERVDFESSEELGAATVFLFSSCLYSGNRSVDPELRSAARRELGSFLASNARLRESVSRFLVGTEMVRHPGGTISISIDEKQWVKYRREFTRHVIVPQQLMIDSSILQLCPEVAALVRDAAGASANVLD